MALCATYPLHLRRYPIELPATGTPPGRHLQCVAARVASASTSSFLKAVTRMIGGSGAVVLVDSRLKDEWRTVRDVELKQVAAYRLCVVAAVSGCAVFKGHWKALAAARGRLPCWTRARFPARGRSCKAEVSAAFTLRRYASFNVFVGKRQAGSARHLTRLQNAC